MQSGNTSINGLFNADRIFNIPKYQRTYTWTERNLSEYLNDLVNHRGEKNYFLGTFLFHQKYNRGEYELIDVVDGQQRLTTTIIFQKELINELIKKSSSKVSQKTIERYIKDRDDVYKLELENDDNSFFHNSIIDEGDIENLETPSQRRLFEAQKYFREEIPKLSKEKLEKIFNVLTNADVIIYVVNKISDATQIFELINDRGRRLTRLESIKSFLMYKISSLKLKEFEQPINDIQGNFSSIYRLLEQHSINENDVLRYHNIAFEKTKSEDYSDPAKYINDKINNLFNTNISDEEIKKEILGYVRRLKKSFDIFKNILTNSISSENLNDVKMIGRINPFYPFLMKVYNEEKSRFDEFALSLSKFTFKATMIGLQNRNEKFYNSIRKDENMFEVFHNPIKWNWWNMNNRFDTVLNYRNFYNSVNKNMVKFLLFKYENSLREKSGFPLLTIENYFETDERKKFSIEHITSQKSKELIFDEDFKENYLHSIGNLVIDSKSSNSRKGNKNVDDKIIQYNQAPVMSQNQIDKDKVDWTSISEVKAFIDKRNKIISEFVKNELIK